MNGLRRDMNVVLMLKALGIYFAIMLACYFVYSAMVPGMTPTIEVSVL